MNTFRGRESVRKYGDIEISVQTVDFVNKKILYIRRNGEADTTFDVRPPKSHLLQGPSASLKSPEADFVCEKTCLIGPNNEKLSVLVNHVAKLLYSHDEIRNLIITTSSKFLNLNSNNYARDFDTILEIISTVKEVL